MATAKSMSLSTSAANEEVNLKTLKIKPMLMIYNIFIVEKVK